jgi:hypothetical protein
MSLLSALAFKRFETLGSTTDMVLTLVLVGAVALSSLMVAQKLSTNN